MKLLFQGKKNPNKWLHVSFLCQQDKIPMTRKTIQQVRGSPTVSSSNILITHLKLVIQDYFECQGSCDRTAISWLIDYKVFH